MQIVLCGQGLLCTAPLLCGSCTPASCLLGCPPLSFFPSACLQVLVRARQQLGEVLSAFEFLDREALDITLRHLPAAKDPLPTSQVIPPSPASARVCGWAPRLLGLVAV